MRVDSVTFTNLCSLCASRDYPWWVLAPLVMSFPQAFQSGNDVNLLKHLLHSRIQMHRCSRGGRNRSYNQQHHRTCEAHILSPSEWVHGYGLLSVHAHRLGAERLVYSLPAFKHLFSLSVVEMQKQRRQDWNRKAGGVEEIWPSRTMACSNIYSHQSVLSVSYRGSKFLCSFFKLHCFLFLREDRYLERSACVPEILLCVCLLRSLGKFFPEGSGRAPVQQGCCAARKGSQPTS